MDIALRPRLTLRRALLFLGLFAALYIAALAVAERQVARSGAETAFQKLLLLPADAQTDWLVLGASHALPLEYGGVPERLAEETGQSMTILADIGAGPLYNLLVLDQALNDLQAKHILYVVDGFAFADAMWNEERFNDRALLRQMPLRLSTLRILMVLALEYQSGFAGPLDYVTGFSKLNPVNRFPQDGWRGVEDFDRTFRPSRHAVSARIAYLYPEGPPNVPVVERYLEILEDILDRAEEAGATVSIAKFPVAEGFRQGLLGEDDFDRALTKRLMARGVTFHDFSVVLPEPRNYFDTDHLNREGVRAFYEEHLRQMLVKGDDENKTSR